MLPCRRSGAWPAAASAVAVVMPHSSLANDAQDQDRRQRQDRRHEKRNRGTQWYVVPRDSPVECPSCEHMGLIDWTSVGQDLDDIKVSNCYNHRELCGNLNDITHHR